MAAPDRVRWPTAHRARRSVNLVGHVAAAVEDDPPPPVDFLVGCTLPDLRAILRVRSRRPGGELGRGVGFHYACDAAFHRSEWFGAQSRALRETLSGAGIDVGPARACAHA